MERLNESFIHEFNRENASIIEDMRREQEARTTTERDAFQRLWRPADEMLKSAPPILDCLLEPLLPRVGLAALVGTSDSGKSTLLRGLAMAIAAGRGDYLGFKLKPLYHRAIYVATEDDEASITSLMRRQIDELMHAPDIYDGLEFLFDTDDLVERLDKRLAEAPADVVVVDAFADLYSGPLNENNRVRSFLQHFSHLAQKHSVLIIFLHHTGKRTESLAPSKHNAIGSQGFEAKMRLVIELRPDPVRHDIRHLCVVKGNYLSAEYKHDSYEMRFTSGLNFVATGERVPFGSLRDQSEERNERVEQVLALRNEGKTMQEIADILGYKSKSSVSYILKSSNE